MKTVQYWGAGNIHEGQITGKSRLWYTGMSCEVSDDDATTLMAYSSDFRLDQADDIKKDNVVTAQTNPLTGMVEIFDPATGLPIPLGVYFASGDGWARVFDGVTDTTRLVHLSVPIDADDLATNCTIKVTHYWTEVGSSTKNIIVGVNDTSASKSFSVVSSSTGTGIFTVNEIQFGNSLTYPRIPNQGYASGGSNNAPVSLPIDANEGIEILFYTYANANLTNAESVTLENVKVEILK